MRTTRVSVTSLLIPITQGLAAPTTAKTIDRVALLFVNNRLDASNILSLSGCDDDCCQWRGGIIHLSRRVTALGLSDLDLSGSIPPDIGNLTLLQFLNLSHNHLQGQLPPELGNLLHLESLRLGSNRLTGEIPAEMGALHKLVILSLHDNNLTGRIPPSLGNVSSLTHLDLAGNRLTDTLPSSLGSLPALHHLSVTRNNLTGAIPTSIFHLSTLTHLYLGRNQFSGSFPSDMGKLVDLRSLSVRDNSLEAKTKEDWEFFASFTNCKHLHTLNLSHNKLEGELPTPITDLSRQLTFIGLGGNNIANEPTSADLARLLPGLHVDKTAATGTTTSGGTPKPWSCGCDIYLLLHAL
ncbi:LRR receptor-like serine threonine-protein kinase [Musa troglodytarum]|uniref:LRR receptor-like serine threonine-protein kinase n=1 Tax=Musa troglodytarum TaxID=320322 RepID=A0A9E7FRT1_9LILI|nr:LRR receptor-like serine threonine-protein kinase [Musa troglodytarum]